MSTIFCPLCSTLILAALRCPACGWARPVAPGAGHEAWRIAIDFAHARVPFGPAVAGGVWWLPTESGDLIGLDAQTGARRHVLRPDPNAYALALAAAGDLLLVGLCDTQPIPSGARSLLALDGRSGAEVWRYATSAHSLSAAAVDGETIFFTSSSGQLHALAYDGALRWSVSHPAWGPTAPAVAEGVVVAGGRDHTLSAYSAATGQLLWRVSGEAWFAGPVALAGGCAFTLAFDGVLLALDLASGAPRWRARGERGKGFTSSPAAFGERVFIGDRVFGKAGGESARGYALRALRAGAGAEL
ncbi:MAG: PQQ-binding-like beta-propeller repeat protein, partial [Chloroflexales bacterium]|nr:PQQ-binding-like beta-propeller repeat protein [Chloroflexales bacterium]